MTKYTDEVQRLFHSIPNPVQRFIVDPVERLEYPGLLILQVYKPNTDSLNEREKIAASTYLYQVRDLLQTVVETQIMGIDAPPPHLSVVLEQHEARKRYREKMGGVIV